jgi:DNA invertase Pin-like site-specific DNA recombinase
MFSYVREGDVLVIAKLDRIARSTKHLLQIVETLEKEGVGFRVLNINLDTSTPTGKLMLTMLAAIATFEREMLLERQKEGIRLAKNNGVYKGRKPTAQAKAVDVIRMVREGKSKVFVAKELEISLMSIYRIMKAGAATA